VGASSISAFPLFSGFVSKSMIMAAAGQENMILVWLALLFASAGVFHHAGIKIPFFAFFSHDSGIRCKEAPNSMLVAMSIAAAFCIFNGCFPEVFLYRMLPFEVDYIPYTSSHVISQLQILFYSALAFTWLKLTGLYPPELRSVVLDFDWTYRRLLPAAIGGITRTGRSLQARTSVWLQRDIASITGSIRRQYGPQSIFARNWSTGSTVLWVALLLGAVLILYYM
jgi:multicomponent Na+:H+ antiporter subunit D